MNNIITDFDLHLWTDPFLSLSIRTKSIVASVATFLLCYGTLSHFLIISFERDAGDPQKRGLKNQAIIRKLNKTCVLKINALSF